MEDTSQDQEVKVNPTDQPPGTGGSLNLSDIEALKDRIEQQKANKLKAEQLVNTLSRIKAREKATRRTIKPGEKKSEDSVSSQPVKRSTANSNALKEKSNLLKKKLEEDRARFESKKGQEDLGRVSEIVEHIRVQLEDQDKTIQQIHSNFAATTKGTQPVENVVPAEPDIPPEVKQKITDLEMKILDLQENLREKDSVISARTQAITLLSEDMARKGKNTLDTLEETRCQMKEMQANFIALEDRMNEEKTRLREELENKKLRLQQIEKNYRTAESARFDLSTRVAELQEKVVVFQTKNLTLEKEVVEATNKSKELKEALENSNKQTIKMKAQFKAKLRALEEERDMLRKEDKSNEELTRLRERIADLEDEKEAGNLLKERISEMEEKLQRQECDLDSHIKAITSLETERLDLLGAINKKSSVLKEKEDMLELMQRQISHLEESKITAEMKCLELEEKFDNFIKTETDTANLNLELEKAKEELVVYQDMINELNIKLQTREIESTNSQFFEDKNELKNIQDTTSNLVEWQNRYSALEQKLNSTLVHCEELELKKTEVEYENEKLVYDCNQLRETVNSLNSILTAKSGSPNEDIYSLKQELAKKEMEISNLTKHSKTLETEVDNLRYTLQSTTSQLHDLYQQVEELSCTRQKVEELSSTLTNKEKELDHTASALDERSRKLSEYKKFHKLKSEDVLRISHELETVSASSQQKISELEELLNTAQKVEEDLRREIKDLKDCENKEPESTDTKLQDQSLKIKKLAANLKLKTKLIKDLEAKIEDLNNAIQQNEIVICSLESEKANLQKQLVESCGHGNHLSPNLHSLEEKCKILESEVESLKEELISRTNELDSLKCSSSEKHETLVQIKELENQNKKLNDISETKSDQLRKMEDEISDLSGLNRSLLSELEQMQETYKQDALKNESVLDSFEHEMLGNKKDIQELSNQLKDVTSKYEQTWAKLQEKEGYIEDLEQQLEKVKSRLLQIESTVEDRRRSLEEKAEMLGARLCQAEKNNEQLEKHEDELEQKIVYLLNTEEMLGSVLEKLKGEHSEMSKSLSESADKNIELSQELDNECNKSQYLAKQIDEMQVKLINYEKMSEDFESFKLQLKEAQEARDNQVKYLENCLAESEQCMEGEIRRLSEKVTYVETERQEVIDKFNALLLEKQMLEDEMGNLQQTIADITKEELVHLKNNQECLAEQMNKELEKRKAHIHRIQELESQLVQQNVSIEINPSLNNDDVLELKKQLEKIVKENETLKYELMKERAKKQVDDVVSKAEQTYFTMVSPSNSEIANIDPFNINVESETTRSTSHFFSEAPNVIEPDLINTLKHELSVVVSENTDLKTRLQEIESKHGRKISENTSGLTDGDDWTAVNKDEDDGWGWGSKDAMLEHEYIQKQKFNSELEVKVADLERRLYSLEEENKRLAEELRTSQTKCSKLLKKLKEFKIKSDSLERNSRERSVGFDDLDFAMQEELRSQVEKLEKSLKESNANINTLQIEREHFLKRIDTLTSGNERLVEMKERQDIEVGMWQRKSHELQNKVQGLEWTIAELQAESKSTEGSYDFSTEEKQHFLTNALELEEKLNALAAENDYLQSLIVELKDKGKQNSCSLNFVPQTSVDNSNQSPIFDDKYLLLQQENIRLNAIIQTFKEKLQVESEHVNGNFEEYFNKIDNLVRENELLSSSVEKLKNKTDHNSSRDLLLSNEGYNLLKSENDHLTSSVIILNEQLSELKSKYEGLLSEKSSYDAIIKQLEIQNEVLKVQVPELSKNDQSNIPPVTDESPVLFRGFISSNDDKFELPPNNLSSTLFEHANDAKQAPSLSTNIPASITQPIDFFDTVSIKPDSVCKEGIIKPVNSSQVGEGKFEENEISTLTTTHNVEIENFKTLLHEKEMELNALMESVTKLEERNSNLQIESEKQFTNEERFKDVVVWGPLSGTSINDANSWNNELSMLNKQIEEKDTIITDLKDKLELKNNSLFGEENGEFHKLIPNPNNDFGLFSESANSHESEMNCFVEQITQLTKTLNDKEIEVKLLHEKNKKYKEIYYALAKECDIQSPNKSSSDNDQLTTQNIMLNQLLEDKETELEIMSQQMEQSMVAKENLQDELSLKICEMKAVNSSFDIPELPKEILLPSSQPENIEDVRTLCAEISELTKLLQEKESEVEILKQQVDELRLEKENLLDEWKKESEEYKEQASRATVKAEEMGKELEKFQDVVSDIEKKYKDEIFLKEQQLMNAMNDLRNTRNYCEDMQTKLNSVEDNLKSCCSQNNLIMKELNDARYIQNSIDKLTEAVGGEGEMNLIEKIQKLINEFEEIKVKISDAKIEIVEKDKRVNEMKEKVRLLESNTEFNNKTSNEEPQSSVQLKTYTSESFRISTEQSSSDDDSSSKVMDNVQGQMFLMKEIQSLKQVLSMKDAEITRLSIAQNEAQENLIKGELRFLNSEEESLRHRLDEALYTLHLRDVRCDELSLELMQLLEERDSLQLRLSTAIRLNEKLREQMKLLDDAAIKLECESDSSPLKGEDNTNNQQLKEKLDQLHNVGYRRDPGLQQEQQKRHQEQMQLFTHQTSPDDSQQSSGFFSWIFGNSSSGSQDV